MKRTLPLLALLASAMVLAGSMVIRSRDDPAEPAMLPRDYAHQVVYVALGDSTVVGLGAGSAELSYVGWLAAWLRDVYPNLHLVNLGVSGATASNVLQGQLPRSLDLSPDLLTLSVGPNDLTQGRTVEAFEADVAAIFEALSQGNRVVVVNLLPDLSLAPVFAESARPRVAQLTVEFNEALVRQALAFGVEIVDLYGPSQEELPHRPELFSRDGYHPSDEGYARWAELVWPAIEARIPAGKQ